MAKKGIYQKYNTITNLYYIIPDPYLNTEGNLSGTDTVYQVVSINRNTGIMSVANPISVGAWVARAMYSTKVYTLYDNGLSVYTFNGKYHDTSGRKFYDYKSNYPAALPVVNYNYSRGAYLTDIIADYGSLPADGRYTDGYWYVFVKMASDLKVNDHLIWRDAPTGFANVNGIMRPQSEFKANVNGIYK